MKTFCPNCGQEYDLAGNLMNIELECSVCHRKFISKPVSSAPQVAPIAPQVAPIAPQVAPIAPQAVPFTQRPRINPNANRLPQQPFLPAQPGVDMLAPDRMLVICPECNHMYQMDKSMHWKWINCIQCDNSFLAKPAKKCPFCRTLNHAMRNTCKQCMKDISLMEDTFAPPKDTHSESTWKKILFWPLSVLTLIWICHADILMMFLFGMNGLSPLPAFLASFALYYLVITIMFITLINLSHRLIRWMRWPLGVNIVLNNIRIAMAGLPVLGLFSNDKFSMFIVLLISVFAMVINLFLSCAPCSISGGRSFNIKPFCLAGSGMIILWVIIFICRAL